MSNIDIHYPMQNTETGEEENVQRFVPVTASLYSAMKYTRRKRGAPRVIWIDAICVNQNDHEERSQQVRMMQEIYHQADNVIVWLGEGDKVSHKCIRTIRTISDRFQETFPKAASQGYNINKKPRKWICTKKKSNDVPEQTGPKAKPNKLRGEKLHAVHHPLLEGIGADQFVDEWPLFEMSWFRRTWVVQEIYNAREATVQCGHDTLTWPMVLRVNQCIRGMRLKANSGFKAVMPPLFADLADQSTHSGILDVLIKGLDFDASDPRDKIFAMLQFGKELQDVAIYPPEIRPNYNKSVVEVFSDFTRWWILTHKSLRILSALHAENGRTWQETLCHDTPDTSGDRPSWSLWYSGHSHYAKSSLGLPEDCPYNACASTTLDTSLILSSQDPLSLPLQGHKISTIEEITHYPYYIDPPNDETLHEVYVYIFDPINDTGKWTRDVFSEMKKYRTPADTPLHDFDHFRAHQGYAQTTVAIQCHSRCYFRTVDGLRGLCPPYARERDIVVVLNGGQVPFVLRPLEKDDGERRYRLIGECYFSGYMDGKALLEQKEKDKKTEIFELV